MKKILSICLVLMLASTTVMAANVISSKDNPAFLYVLSAKSGSFEGDTLILRDVPQVIYFSDRPDRIAGHMSLKQFVEKWNDEFDKVKSDPPNASLSTFDKQESKIIVVELSDLQIKGNTLVYKVRVLEGDMIESFDLSALFIDDFPTAVVEDSQFPDQTE